MTISNDNSHIRMQYHAAAENKHLMQQLIDSCDKLKDNQNSTVKGYCNMVHFLEAKNSFNPYKKFSEFNSGKRVLDSLIQADPLNIELRYMRHSIQDRAPGFLGYKNNLTEDEAFMKSNVSATSDSAAYRLIYNYLYKPTE